MDSRTTLPAASGAAFAALLVLAGLAGPALASEHGDRLAVLETGQGTIVMEFFPADAPNHVDNFVGLVESGFYDGTVFHRIIPGFMIQGGDPNTVDGDPATWGTGGPGTAVDAEFNQIKHDRGIVSMARSADPNSAGSQFFIVHSDSNFLDGQYTVFGRVVTEESLETLDRIAAVQTTGNAGGNKPVDAEQVRITRAVTVDRDDAPGTPLDLPEPERMQSPAPAIPTPFGGQAFDADKHGITVAFPRGWTLQQPEKISEHTPDVIAIGPKTGMMHPAIIMVIKQTNERGLNDLVAERFEMLRPSVESKGLEILSRGETAVNGMQAYTIEAQQTSSPADGELVVKFKEVLLYGPEKFYTFTYSNGADAFDVQLPAFDQTVDSFGVLDGDGAGADPAADADTGADPDTDTGADPDTDTGADTGAPAGQQSGTGSGGEEEEGGDCLIAAAAYGSEMAPQVQQLREIRDGAVLSTGSGAAFMAGAHQVYYSFSPAIADMERENPFFREAVRLAITPMLYSMSILGHADAGSEADVLAYGIGVILLNLGMYVAAPAVAVHKIRRAALRRRQRLPPAAP